jgi:ligand-binding sensor domain-containing protein/serine phosphatase RsbU (regulator of sigma subunit)
MTVNTSGTYKSSGGKLLFRIICITLFLQYSVSGYSQRYNFESYNVDNGFPATVYCIFQDSRGYLWFGTDGQGICRVDGISKVYFDKTKGLAGNTVRSIIEDNNHNLWIATDEGISIFNGLSFRSIKEKDGLSSNIVVCLFKDRQNNIIAGTAGEKGGLNKIHPVTQDSFQISVKNKETDLTVNSIFSIYQDKWDRYWVGTFGGGINVISPNFKEVIKYFTTVDHFPSNYILSFTPTGNTLWAGTFDKGAIAITIDKNIDACKSTIIAADSEKENTTIWKILPSTRDTWYGTNLNGLICNSGSDVIRMNEQNGLSKNQIIGLYSDRENNVWVSAFDGGVSRFLGRQFVHYTKADASFIEDITSLKIDKAKTLWMGTYSNGLYSATYVNKKITPKYIGLKGENIYSIAIDQAANIWIATNHGIHKYNGQSFTNYNRKNSGILNDNVTCILVARDNRVWCGTSKGISLYNGQKFINTKEGYLPNTEIQTFIQDKKGNVWCGTMGGLVKFHGDTVTSFDEEEGLFHKKIYTLALDNDDCLWIGTFGGGIYKLLTKASKKGKDTLVAFSGNELLTSLNISSLHFLDNSTLLAGTDNGMSKIALNDEGNVISVNKYGLKEGFTGVKCNPNVLSVMDSSVWIGTSKGLTMYQPVLDTPNKSIPQINITHVKLFFKDVDWQKEGYKVLPWSNIPDNLKLKHSQNHITIEFSGILFSDKEEILYRYKLEGLDKDWSPAIKKTDALYTSLSPGSYIFKVIAANRYGQWSKPATFSFIITPPFWKTWWFYVLVTLIAFAGIVAYIKYRERKLRNERDKLEVAVIERTKEVVAQKREIEEKQKAIKESIEYAQRLQAAAIPSNDLLEEVFTDSFIFYKPKDIVSGDFYWYGKHNGRIFVIAADCTGHGVPGAINSMLGISLLNKIIGEGETTSPDEILNKLRENIITSLKQTVDSPIQDGMDLVILSFNSGLTELEFSGANNSMFIIRDNAYFDENGEKDCASIRSESHFLIEISGQKMPASIYPLMNTFKKEVVKLYPHDKIYIFSDGYMDQIGGPNDKRFMKKQFKLLLLDIHTLPMQEQRDILDSKNTQWVNGKQQTDDILVMGMACN